MNFFEMQVPRRLLIHIWDRGAQVTFLGQKFER